MHARVLWPFNGVYKMRQAYNVKSELCACMLAISRQLRGLSIHRFILQRKVQAPEPAMIACKGVSLGMRLLHSTVAELRFEE